jgi:TolB protein
LLRPAGVVLVVGALATFATQATATFPGDNGAIAFSVPAAGHDHIFVMDARGDHTRQLTHGQSSDLHPAFSADGQSIAFDHFVGNTAVGIYVVDAGGGSARHVPKTGGRDGAPAFSPNGKRIAFQSYRGGGGSQVWTRGVDGGHPRQLTHADADSYGPAYSPDGHWIAFVRSAHLYLMHTDGSGARRLTAGRYDSSPAFSSDGRRIAFTRNGDVYVLRLERHRLHRLTRTAFDEGAPRFSPDGRRIVFSRAESLSGEGFDKRGIYVMRADGAHVRRVDHVPSAGLDWQPLPR